MKSRCADVELLLTEYAAGDLPVADVARVSGHLESCAACRDELAAEQRLRATLNALPQLSCPVEVSVPEQVVTGRTERGRRAGRGEGRHWLWGGAGLAAAVVLLIVLLPSTPPPPPDRIVDSTGRTWSRTEIETARLEAKWSLALTAKILDRTGRRTVTDIFGRRLPRAVTGSLEKAASIYEGGQG